MEFVPNIIMITCIMSCIIRYTRIIRCLHVSKGLLTNCTTEMNENGDKTQSKHYVFFIYKVAIVLILLESDSEKQRL